MKLTQASIAKLKLPAGKTDFIAWDDELPGFGLRIREGGSRLFVVQYKLGAKTRRMTLGAGLEAARKNAKTILARVRLGEDPQADRVTAKAAAPQTFKSVADAFLAFQANSAGLEQLLLDQTLPRRLLPAAARPAGIIDRPCRYRWRLVCHRQEQRRGICRSRSVRVVIDVRVGNQGRALRV